MPVDDQHPLLLLCLVNEGYTLCGGWGLHNLLLITAIDTVINVKRSHVNECLCSGGRITDTKR
jgi:hypothetical protein